MTDWQSVKDFETALCEYTGAPHAVCVNTCTMALFLSLMAWEAEGHTITIPKYTYLSVPMMIKHAGGHVAFEDIQWSGVYQLKPFPIYDSARRFTSGMYQGGFQCVSFHPTKILGISTGGGAILHDYIVIDKYLRRARFHGRTEGVDPRDDRIAFCGFEARMWPTEAQEGLHKLSLLPRANADLPNSDYPDLSTIEAFQ